MATREDSAMRETHEDVVRLQALLDDSYAAAGRHHREIHSDRARLTAQQVVDRLQGMKVFVVATSTREGRPLTGPVETRSSTKARCASEPLPMRSGRAIWPDRRRSRRPTWRGKDLW